MICKKYQIFNIFIMMKNIKTYKERFYNLMESTIGDVKPLIIENVNIENRKTIINSDGTVTIYNDKKQPQKIRFSIDGPLYSGDVNVKDIKFENGIYCIVTKKEHIECFEKQHIIDILKFVDKNTPNSIYFGMVKGNLKMRKV